MSPHPHLPQFCSPQQSAAYGNAEVRGQLRQWKERLARDYRVYGRAFNGCHAVNNNMALCSTLKGRRRAFGKLARAFGPGVMLEGLRLEGKHPLAVWSILKPREAFAVGALPESGKAQDCVTVNYVLAGAVLGEGLWSLEVPDHALGRCIECSGLLPGALISEAHHNLLRLRAETVAPGGVFDDRRFLVKAGSGGFVCSLWAGQNVSLGGECSISVHADTWLAGDMLHADQILLADDGEPGARLGDGWFVPAPLRSIADEGNGLLRLSLWGPALPELLAKPQGRA